MNWYGRPLALAILIMAAIVIVGTLVLGLAGCTRLPLVRSAASCHWSDPLLLPLGIDDATICFETRGATKALSFRCFSVGELRRLVITQSAE